MATTGAGRLPFDEDRRTEIVNCAYAYWEAFLDYHQEKIQPSSLLQPPRKHVGHLRRGQNPCAEEFFSFVTGLHWDESDGNVIEEDLGGDLAP
jgi:hypothetical protein